MCEFPPLDLPPRTEPDHDRAVGPAISRVTPEERAIVVRWVAQMALARALDEEEIERLGREAPCDENGGA